METSSIEGGRASRSAVVGLLAVQTLVFSAAGWLLGMVLDVAGALSLSNSLFVSGLLTGVIAGLVAIEGSDLPAALSLRAARTVSMFGLAERPGL
ncbi:MAG TPA: hypothetical protein VNH40_14825, partial [Gaiellaceae bacterium]|nr:hypothetical protein [Gaiellaceae bacterium]